jgi:hypothetical protein
MMNIGKITPKKFKLTDTDYELAYKMFKDNIPNTEVAKKLKISNGQVSIVMSQIVSYMQMQKHKNDIIEANLNFKEAGQSSFKDLLLPVNNEPTIGTAKVVNGKIYSDGILWK